MYTTTFWTGNVQSTQLSSRHPSGGAAAIFLDLLHSVAGYGGHLRGAGAAADSENIIKYSH